MIAIAPTRIVVGPPRWANDGGLKNNGRHPAMKAAKAAARSGGTRISLMPLRLGSALVAR